jgi:uncharacterized protein YutE (UPF0331/DUF86 family)
MGALSFAMKSAMVAANTDNFGTDRQGARLRLENILPLALCAALSGCVNLSAVGDFAKESSVISANKALLDDTDAQTEAREYALALNLPNSFADPASKEFTDRLAVTAHALTALNAYMTVLAQLSAKDVANVSSEVSTIGTALKSLNVTDPKLQPGLNAATSLANILLNEVIRKDVKKLIDSAAAPVDDIANYLVDQAQTTSNTYNQAIAVSNRYWGSLTAPSKGDSELCRTANLCKTVSVLANRARDADNKNLSAKAAAADTATAAFKKIRNDNAALVKNTDHLDDKALIAMLKSDEPDLQAAIRTLKSLKD